MLCRQAEVAQTKVSLAFFLPDGAAEHVPPPEKQYVYAFLPTKQYGLKFVVQVCWVCLGAGVLIMCMHLRVRVCAHVCDCICVFLYLQSAAKNAMLAQRVPGLSKR
jgi:hypothetical protein